MARAVSRTWYRVAVERGGAVELVAAAGEHLGEAVAAAEQSANGRAFAAAAADEADIPLGESVGKTQVVALGAPKPGHEVIAPTTAGWQWPRGVMPALGAEAAVAGARPGWRIIPDEQLLVIEAMTDAEHVTDLFLGLLERLPAADNLEVRVQSHFEDARTTDVWLTSRVNAKKILRFLDDYDEELIDNGHIELSIYVRAHKATLRLTEHKTVVWLAEGGALEADVERWLGELGVPRATGHLVTVLDAPHFHYRRAKSRSRKKLSDELYRQRLRRVATVPRDTAG